MSEEKNTQGSNKAQGTSDKSVATPTIEQAAERLIGHIKKKNITLIRNKPKMNPSTKNRLIRLIIYFIVVFIAAFLYSYFKRN